MTCAEAAERITALVDAELAGPERAELERHLASCGSCREAREAEEAVAARLRSLPRAPLPAGFAASVMGRVAAAPSPAAAPPPRARVIPYWVLLVGGSAAAAAVVAMVMVGTGARQGILVAERTVRAPGPAAAPPAGDRAALESLQAAGGKAAEGPATPGEFVAAADMDRAAAPPPAPKPSVEDALREEGKAADGKSGDARDRVDAARRKPAAATPPAGPPAAAKSPAGGTPAPPSEEKAEDDGAGDLGARGRSLPGDKGKKDGAGSAPAPESRTADAAAEAERRDAPQALPRVLLFFRAESLPRGQDAVDKVLVSRPDLVRGRESWRRTAADAVVSGRLKEAVEKEVPKAALEAALTAARSGIPEERILEVRVRVGDLEALRGALSRAPSLVETHALVANLDLDEATLEEVRKRFKAISGRGGGPPAPGPGDGFGAAGADEAGGGGGEPAPPPPPTPEQLRRLAEAPPPERPSPAGGEGGEVILEVHLRVEPPPETGPAPAKPAEGPK